ncbi:MAG: YifB family Mg chelatase-like AAA ATPase [Candidatus Kaiserbacteria bacterium]|nr:YifB family Mg chelatase-like AAA ATPase [Candidatus Kaiserbacteria bacterium]
MKKETGSTLHAYTYSTQRVSLAARTVRVEADISPGIHSFSIIGLPDKAVDEARERVSAAIKHAGLVSPKRQNHKVVVSLAPGDLKKTGTLFDVPIALTYLLAMKNIRCNPEKKMFVGELALDGSIQQTQGILPIVQHAKKNSFEEVYIPAGNTEEATLIDGIHIIPCKSLQELIAHLQSETSIPPVVPSYVPADRTHHYIGFEYIKGQESVKRALTVAGAGGHNVALYGPPGTGKTLLAKALISILPPLTKDECVEVTALHSISHNAPSAPMKVPPFRSPHHTSSYASITGGGAALRPGEISLAHRGVLFLDEFPEFDRRVIESLREPLEEHAITVTRASGSVSFPASCILAIAFNLCPCGNTGTDRMCSCSPSAKASYRRKLTGPITDRIDVWVSVEASGFDDLEKKQAPQNTEQSHAVKIAVRKAREMQIKRYTDTHIHLNSEADARIIESHLAMPPESVSVLQSAATKLSLSPRGYHRTIKCARTIADLAESTNILPDHILEAVTYRTPPVE